MVTGAHDAAGAHDATGAQGEAGAHSEDREDEIVIEEPQENGLEDGKTEVLTEALTEVTPAEPEAATAEPAWTPTAAASRRRASIRWGGVVWGLILGVFAAGSLWVLASTERLAAATTWFRGLTPSAGWALVIAAVGAIIAVSALLAAISAGQRRRSAGTRPY